VRTTLDIDAPVLKDLKRIQKQEGKTLGELASELLAWALAHRNKSPRPKQDFKWVSKHMDARIDLEDREAISTVLSREEHSR
jgi:hypothetical protein